MSKPVIVLAERNTELRDRLFCQLLCQGFDVIESLNMSEVFHALRRRRDIGLFIMSASLDEPGDGVEFAHLVGRFGYSPRVILTSTPRVSDSSDAVAEEAFSTSDEQPLPYDDILACVYRSC